MSWGRWAAAECDATRAAGRWREVRELDAAGPRGVLTADGREVVSFASNDYLGLTQHPAVVAAYLGEAAGGFAARNAHA